MSIMMVTSLNSYAKGMQMAMKWQIKQKENNYAPDNAVSSDDSFQKQLDKIRYPEYDRSDLLEFDIEQKMTAGKKLNSEEMQHLRTHKRSLYQTAKRIEQERAVYEKALESCGTKEEVEQLKADYASTAVKRINAIRNNSSISAEKKQELLRNEHFRGAALDDAMYTFMKSPDYKHLPEGKAVQTDGTDENGAEQENQEKGVLGEGLTLEILQTSKARQEEAAKKAAEYEPENREEEVAEASEEEGSIMKAILDEEARWAREEEENPGDSQEEDSSETEGLSAALPMAQAKAAYLAAQYQTGSATASRIDVRK